MSAFQEKAYGAGGFALLGGVMGYNALEITATKPLLGFSLFSAAVGWQAAGSFMSVKKGNLIQSGLYSEAASYMNQMRLQQQSVRYASATRVLNALSTTAYDNNFYINSFKYSNEVKRNFNILNKFLAKKLVEQKKLHMKWEDLKKNSLILGSMGTGKTVFLNNIIKQWIATERKLVIHDTKGEFTSYFYRKDKDYIINPLDKRGVWWNFFADNEKGLSMSLISEFFNSYFVALAGESNDKFFSTNAAQRFSDIVEKLKVKKIATHKKMFQLAVEMEKYFYETEKSQNKTEQSVSATLKTASDIFYRFAYMSKTEKKEFSLVDFYKKDKDSRVFLHTIEEVSTLATPFLTAFISVMFKYQLTELEKCKEEDYVLFILDEYLTFFENMQEKMRTSLHTKARSYGALLLPAIQNFPNDNSVALNLLSSVENLFCFAISEPGTVGKVQDFVGKIRQNSIQSKAKNIDNNEYNLSENYLLDENILKSLKTGEHITFFKSKNVIYKAYTEYADVSEKTETFMRLSFREENAFIDFKSALKREIEKEAKIDESFKDTEEEENKGVVNSYDEEEAEEAEFEGI